MIAKERKHALSLDEVDGEKDFAAFLTFDRVDLSDRDVRMLLKESLDVYMTDERISGVFIWQFADCRVTQEEWFDKRAKCRNNKGIVDEYRRPKLAYDTVKEVFYIYYK